MASKPNSTFSASDRLAVAFFALPIALGIILPHFIETKQRVADTRDTVVLALDGEAGQ